MIPQAGIPLICSCLLAVMLFTGTQVACLSDSRMRPGLVNTEIEGSFYAEEQDEPDLDYYNQVDFDFEHPSKTQQGQQIARRRDRILAHANAVGRVLEKEHDQEHQKTSEQHQKTSTLDLRAASSTLDLEKTYQAFGRAAMKLEQQKRQQILDQVENKGVVVLGGRGIGEGESDTTPEVSNNEVQSDDDSIRKSRHLRRSVKTTGQEQGQDQEQSLLASKDDDGFEYKLRDRFFDSVSDRDRDAGVSSTKELGGNSWLRGPRFESEKLRKAPIKTWMILAVSILLAIVTAVAGLCCTLCLDPPIRAHSTAQASAEVDGWWRETEKLGAKLLAQHQRTRTSQIARSLGIDPQSLYRSTVANGREGSNSSNQEPSASVISQVEDAKSNGGAENVKNPGNEMSDRASNSRSSTEDVKSGRGTTFKAAANRTRLQGTVARLFSEKDLEDIDPSMVAMQRQQIMGIERSNTLISDHHHSSGKQLQQLRSTTRGLSGLASVKRNHASTFLLGATAKGQNEEKEHAAAMGRYVDAFGRGSGKERESLKAGGGKNGDEKQLAAPVVGGLTAASRRVISKNRTEQLQAVAKTSTSLKKESTSPPSSPKQVSFLRHKETAERQTKDMLYKTAT
ncbi:unnamed protein product [Amoebophrya sp. A25]|nr:unnamed protein product [Amoebophrya sp. A25]|eukprot:GSA25T00025887001.1